MLSALVVGSVAPDLGYLLYLAPAGTVSHTVAGLFVFCLPVGFNWFRAFVVNGSIGGMAGLFVAAVLFSLWWHVVETRKPPLLKP